MTCKLAMTVMDMQTIQNGGVLIMERTVCCVICDFDEKRGVLRSFLVSRTSHPPVTAITAP